MNKPRDLPGLALAVKAWRGDRSPDGVVLTLTPDTHTDDTLTQTLRAHRQALGDTARLLATHVPGYVAVYQRLTQDATVRIGSACPRRRRCAMRGSSKASCKRPKQKARATGRARPEARAAGLASLIGWTWRSRQRRARDPRQPASPWPLHGAAWIDCGPASNRGEAPWQAHLRSHTCLGPAPLAASSAPWPLPEPLIDAMPQASVGPAAPARFRSRHRDARLCARARVLGRGEEQSGADEPGRAPTSRVSPACPPTTTPRVATHSPR